MLRKVWLVFAQACTVCLAALFVLTTLRPDLLNREGKSITVIEAAQPTPASHSVPTSIGYREAVKHAMPAVVNIYTSKEVRAQRNPLLNDPVFRHFFGDDGNAAPQKAASLGSGVIVSPHGYVLTNHHVVEGADEIELMLSDGRKLTAKVVGTDPDTDLAVLKANAENLPAISFGSLEKLQVGDIVLAIGNPFGFGGTVTQGIVSALGRNFGINTFESFIQTDAAINPGNSGGALIDIDGNLVGINSNIFSRTGGSEGIGFAIPVSIARSVMDSIIESGSVTRGYLGGNIGPEISADVSRELGLGGVIGVVVEGVVRNGPADRAGVHPKDILVEVNGQHVEDSAIMLNQIAAIAPGRKVTVKVWRDGQVLTLQVEAGKRPPQRS